MNKTGPDRYAACFLVLTLVLAAVPFPGFAAESTPANKNRSSVLAEALGRGAPQAVVKALEKAAAEANGRDRSFFLAALADFEERLGNTAEAALRFREAAQADPAGSPDSLLLDSARCLIQAGDYAGADSAVRGVLLTSFDPPSLLRARVYAAWISLQSGDPAEARSIIRSMADNSQFAAWAPALLLTLWWSGSDTAARDTLIARWPDSPEARIAASKTLLSPSPFWYLMPRSEAAVAAFASAGGSALASQQTQQAQQPKQAEQAETNSPDTAASKDSSASDGSPPSSSVRTWQQVGFFRNREYAADLVSALAKAGFAAEIHESKRPSGTVYFAVLVPDDEKRSVGGRLKNAGFESYLVTE